MDRVDDQAAQGLRLLVTGASGFLGGTVASLARAHGWRVTGTSWSRDAGWTTLDVRDRDAVRAVVHRSRPDVVVHTAASYADWRTTADGSAHVALAAALAGARLVHVSSDAVHAGSAEPYADDAVPQPVYGYGAAKAAAETAVRAVDPGAVVVRTSLIIGHGRSEHEKHVRALLGGAPGVLFTDVVRCPVHVDDLAAALLELAAGDRTGLLNVAGPEAVTRHELGALVARASGADPDLLRAGRTDELGLRLPGDVRLDTGQASGLLATRLRGVREFLRQNSADHP